jgi:hypothetical protein
MTRPRPRPPASDEAEGWEPGVWHASAVADQVFTPTADPAQHAAQRSLTGPALPLGHLTLMCC